MRARVLLKMPTSEAFRVQFREIPRLLGQRLRREGDRIKTKAVDVYVPRDLGTLANSGRVTGPHVAGMLQVVEITFGGAAAPYALAVHEIPPGSGGRWGVGAKHRPPQQFKYLERPVLEAASGLMDRLAKE